MWGGVLFCNRGCGVELECSLLVDRDAAGREIELIGAENGVMSLCLGAENGVMSLCLQSAGI